MGLIEADDCFQGLSGQLTIAAVQCEQGSEVMCPDHVGPLVKCFAAQVGGRLPVTRAECHKSFFDELL